MSEHDEEMAVGGGIVAPDLNNTNEKSQSHHRRPNSDEETVQIGDSLVSRQELIEAVRGIISTEELTKKFKPTLGNPAPTGLCGFALTTFMLSLVNIHARHVTVPNIVVGCAYFYGGAAQFLAGFCEIACGNTFGATAFISYGAFWLSWAAIQTGSFGIGAAYEGENAEQLGSAVGFFLFGWFIFTFMLCICAVRTTVANFSLFFVLTFTFLFLALGDMLDNVALTKVGGWFGLIDSFIAWYNAFKAVANKENSFLVFKDYRMPGSIKRD